MANGLGAQQANMSPANMVFTEDERRLIEQAMREGKPMFSYMPKPEYERGPASVEIPEEIRNANQFQLLSGQPSGGQSPQVAGSAQQKGGAMNSGLMPLNTSMGGLMGMSPTQMAALSAGAALLQGGGPSMQPRSLGQNIGQATQAGIGAFQQGQEQALQRALLQRKLAREDQLGKAASQYFSGDPALAEIAAVDPQLAAQLSRGAAQGDPAAVRALQRFAEMGNLSPEERMQAVRVELGLSPRASSAAAKVVEFGGQKYQQYADGTLVPLSTLEEEAGAEETTAEATARGAGRGQTQADREANETKVLASIEAGRARAQNVSELADSLRERAGPTTVGFLGSSTASVPGTPAYDFAADLETLNAIAGFSELQRMRDSSPTGGALGQVSEREISLLQSTIRSLKQAQSEDQFLRNLDKFEQQVADTWKRVAEAYEQDYGRPYPGTNGQRGKPQNDEFAGWEVVE